MNVCVCVCGGGLRGTLMMDLCCFARFNGKYMKQAVNPFHSAAN